MAASTVDSPAGDSDFITIPHTGLSGLLSLKERFDAFEIFLAEAFEGDDAKKASLASSEHLQKIRVWLGEAQEGKVSPFYCNFRYRWLIY